MGAVDPPMLMGQGSQESTGTTNQRVLLVVTVLFALFVVGEVCAAVLSHSLSLLGDAGAMSVDVFSYFANMIAERIKDSDGDLTRRQRFLLEVAVPSFSVMCLIGVTAWITFEAMQVLMNPRADDEEDVNIYVLWGFSSLNAVVDVISFYMFWSKGRDVFYYQPLSESTVPGEEETTSDLISNNKTASNAHQTSSYKNLNMISAFSHVGGDTLRTLSIFIAAAYATVTGAPGYVVDAWATAIVTLTIVAMICPLILEIYRAYHRLQV